MSQPISPPPMNYVQPGLVPTRTSAAAVTSLICGVLGCFVVTGIVAVITGIVGLKATKNPQVKGRGLAIAGLILGIITTLASVSFLVTIGGAGYYVYKQAAPAIESMTALTDAASSGDINKAMLHVDQSKISKSQVQRVVDELRTLGKPQNFKPRNPNISTVNGVTTVDIDGDLIYPNNVTKSVSVQLVKQADGTFKATKLDVE